MSGVYGDFVEVFPELREYFDVWMNKGDTPQRITAIYMPNRGGGLKRRKYTSSNTGLDMTNEDEFYVSCAFDKILKEGMYVRSVNDPRHIMRLTHDVGYDKAAGYRVYTIERVTGSTEDKDQPLVVKEGYFA